MTPAPPGSLAAAPVRDFAPAFVIMLAAHGRAKRQEPRTCSDCACFRRSRCAASKAGATPADGWAPEWPACGRFEQAPEPRTAEEHRRWARARGLRP